MDKNITLRPCPFCGGEASFGHTTVRTHISDPEKLEEVEYDFVSCVICAGSNDHHSFSNKEEAAKHWNKRTDKVVAASFAMAAKWFQEIQDLADSPNANQTEIFNKCTHYIAQTEECAVFTGADDERK